MKKQIIFMGVFAITLTLPVFTQAQPTTLSEHLQTTLAQRTAQRAHLSQTDAHGTPLVIQLARQGNIDALLQIAASPNANTLLNAQDSIGNNLFHVAKNADTVQVIASLVRQVYGAKASAKISEMVDQKNRSGETPLLAQINAGHADTFRPLYDASTLKKKNDAASRQIIRLQGMREDISGPNVQIYCQEIRQLSSAQGRTLLQAAQDQIPYNPQMSALAQNIGRNMPCLTQGY